MLSGKTRYKIVKEMWCGDWYFVVMKKVAFGWKYVRCDANGDIDLEYVSSIIADSYKIKRFSTEAQAEEAIQNLTYKKDIDLK